MYQIFIFAFLCVFLCMYGCMYVFMYVRLSVCVCVYVCVCYVFSWCFYTNAIVISLLFSYVHFWLLPWIWLICLSFNLRMRVISKNKHCPIFSRKIINEKCNRSSIVCERKSAYFWVFLWLKWRLKKSTRNRGKFKYKFKNKLEFGVFSRTHTWPSPFLKIFCAYYGFVFGAFLPPTFGVFISPYVRIMDYRRSH